MSVHVYIDDLIMRSRFEPDKTEEQMQDDHLQHLKSVILKAQKHGVKFNHKTKWFAKETTFLGRQITRTGIRPVEKNLERIRLMRPPRSRADIQTFLGCVAWLGGFAPFLSKHTIKLATLLRKNSDFVWEKFHQEAFEAIKEELAKPAHRFYLQPNKPLYLQVRITKLLDDLNSSLMMSYDIRWIVVSSKSARMEKD